MTGVEVLVAVNSMMLVYVIYATLEVHRALRGITEVVVEEVGRA